MGGVRDLINTGADLWIGSRLACLPCWTNCRIWPPCGANTSLVLGDRESVFARVEIVEERYRTGEEITKTTRFEPVMCAMRYLCMIRACSPSAKSQESRHTLLYKPFQLKAPDDL